MATIPTAEHCCIVSSKERQIVLLENINYVYIPLTAKERELFGKNIEDPCWRITIK